MTDEKMDMNDFRREMIDRGLDDEEALESLENDRKKIHMLTFITKRSFPLISYLIKEIFIFGLGVKC